MDLTSSPRAAGSSPPLVGRLLGRPSLAWRERDLNIRSRKDRALVCYLAVRGSAPRGELAELLWGRDRLRNVRQALYSLRRRPGAEVWLTEEGHDAVGVVARTDVGAFEAAVNSADFAAALRVWRPGFLEGWGVADATAFTDWCEVERERLETLYRDALRGRIRELEAPRPAEALHLAERLLALDELDEGAHRTTMRTVYRLQGRDAAAARFEACRRVLADELGVGPSDATEELAAAIGRGEEVATPGAPAPPRPGRPAAARGGLYGRERERSRLKAAWAAGRPIVVSGPAGIGTTRLVDDVVAAQGGALHVRGRDGDRDLPYAAVTRAVEAAVRLRPELAAPPWLRDELARVDPGTFGDGTAPAPAAPEEGRARLHRAILAVLHGIGRAATLVVDDLQRVDTASLGRFVEAAVTAAPSPGRAPVVLAYRDEAPDPALEASVRRVVEAGGLHLRLGGLDVEAVRRLLGDLGAPLPEGDGLDRLAARLHRYTGGNPSFVRDTVQDLASRHRRLDPEVPFALPDRVNALLRHRLDELSPPALRVARALRVTGADAAPDLIAEIVDLAPGALMEALEELEAARVLDGARFVHDLLPQAIAAHTPDAVRRFLHGRAARALEARADEARPAPIARHWLAAGDPDRAAPQLAAAAREAGALYADEEARRRWFETLWAADATREGTAPLRAAALLGLESVAARRGDLDEAAWALRAAEDLANHEQDDALLFDTALRRAGERIRSGRPREAMAAADEARGIAERLDRADMIARATLQLGGAAFHAGDLVAAGEAFGRAATAGAPTLRLRAINNLGVLAGIRGDVEGARRHQEEALTLARAHGTLDQVAGLLHNLAATDDRHGRYGRARAAFDEAAALYRRIDDRSHERGTLLNLADVDTKLGAFAAADRALRELPCATSAEAPLRGRALLLRGQLERALGRPDRAVEALAAAREHALEGQDERSAAIAEFNLAMARAAATDVPLDAGGAHAAVADLVRLELADVLPWAHAELVWVLDDPDAIEAHLESIAPAHDHPHLALLAELARHRAAWAARAPSPAAERLAELAAANPVAEAPLAHLLVAQATGAEEAPTAADHRERAARLLRDQVAGLPAAAAAARRRFVEATARRMDRDAPAAQR